MNIYDRETFRKIRNDKIYEINKVDHKPVMVTKETLLTMALNWGQTRIEKEWWKPMDWIIET